MKSLTLRELLIDLQYEQELTDTTPMHLYCIPPLKIRKGTMFIKSKDVKQSKKWFLNQLS